MALRYEITKENAVLIYDEGSSVPSLSQPHDPEGNGTPFASKTAAETWAKKFLARLTDPNWVAPVEEETPADETEPTEPEA